MAKNIRDHFRDWFKANGRPTPGSAEHEHFTATAKALAAGDDKAAGKLFTRLVRMTDGPVREAQPGHPIPLVGSRDLPSTVPETGPVKRVQPPGPAAEPPLDTNRVLNMLHAAAKHMEKHGPAPAAPAAPAPAPTGPPPGTRVPPNPAAGRLTAPAEAPVPLTLAPEPPVPLTYATPPKRGRLVPAHEVAAERTLQHMLRRNEQQIARLARKPDPALDKFVAKNLGTEPEPGTAGAKRIEKKPPPDRLLEPTRAQLFQNGIHAAFRGTGVAYHTLRLMQHAKHKVGEGVSGPLRQQAAAILKGQPLAKLKKLAASVNPFTAFGRWFKMQGDSGTVPSHLGDLADRFNWDTADRRHSLDAQVYDLFHDHHGRGDHGRTDRLLTDLYHQSRRAPEAWRKESYGRIKAALGKRVGDLPSNFHDELHKSLERLHSYAMDRRMVAEGDGGQVSWRDWFKGASREGHGGKVGDPLRLARGSGPSLSERIRRLFGLSAPPSAEQKAWSQHMSTLTGGEALPAHDVVTEKVAVRGSNADAPKGLVEGFAANNRHRDTLREALLASGHSEREATQLVTPAALDAWRLNGVTGLIDSETAAGRHGTAKEIAKAGVAKLRHANVLPYPVDAAVAEPLPAKMGQLDLYGQLAEETKASKQKRASEPRKPKKPAATATPSLFDTPTEE